MNKVVVIFAPRLDSSQLDREGKKLEQWWARTLRVMGKGALSLTKMVKDIGVSAVGNLLTAAIMQSMQSAQARAQKLRDSFKQVLDQAKELNQESQDLNVSKTELSSIRQASVASGVSDSAQKTAMQFAQAQLTKEQDAAAAKARGVDPKEIDRSQYSFTNLDNSSAIDAMFGIIESIKKMQDPKQQAAAFREMGIVSTEQQQAMMSDSFRSNYQGAVAQRKAVGFESQMDVTVKRQQQIDASSMRLAAELTPQTQAGALSQANKFNALNDAEARAQASQFDGAKVDATMEAAKAMQALQQSLEKLSNQLAPMLSTLSDGVSFVADKIIDVVNMLKNWQPPAWMKTMGLNFGKKG